MNMLANLKADDDIKTETDSVGSGGVVDSGLYPAEIELAYLEEAKSEALALVVHFKTDSGRTIQQKLWMTGGKDKGKKNYWTDKDDVKHFLPGFNHANALALLTVKKEISELEPEEKVVKLWNYEAKAEVPTKVQVVTELLKQRVILGVLKQTVDKTKLEGSVYVPTGETRDENEVDKIFRESDKMTTAEIRAGATEAEFYATWDKKFTGTVRNKAKGAAAGGVAGAPKGNAGAASPKPGKSLFG